MPVRSRPAGIRRRLGAPFLLAATVGACAAPPPRLPATPAPVLPAEVRVGVNGRIETVPLERYVTASVLAELAPVGEPPAVVARLFEVQAILARTYAVAHPGRHAADGFDLCATTHCQLYDPARLRTSRFAEAAAAAAGRTAGRVLVYGPRPARTHFHSDCGGHTAAADEVWGGAPVPYLQPHPDPVGDVHRRWSAALPRDRLRAALNADRRSAVGRELSAIGIVLRDGSGRAARVGLRGEHSVEVGGETFRTIVNAAFGERTVRSTRFEVRATAGGWELDGTGFGHGVGLCQTGALARARRGDPVAGILGAYFPGTTLAGR